MSAVERSEASAGGEKQAGGRTGRRGRLLRRLVLAAGAFALLVAAVAFYLLATESGARWLFTRVGGALPGTLEVRQLEGPIRGPLTLQGLVYSSEGMEITVDRLVLDWRLRALLRKRLDIVRLDAEGVDVLLAESEDRGDEPTVLPDIHLPINIIVRQATVRGVEVVRGGGGEPLVIDAVELATRAVGDAVEVEALTVRSPRINADVSGRVQPQGAYPVDLKVSWSADLPDQPVWAAEGELSGTLEELRVVQRLREPIVARLDATLLQPLRELAFDATVRAETFPLRALAANLPEATVGGSVRAEGQVEAFRATADLRATTPELGPVAADLRAIRDGELWTIERLLLTFLAAQADGEGEAAAPRLEVVGEAELPAGSDPRFDLRASWNDLVWPLTGEPTVRSRQGELAVAGTVAAYELEAQAIVATGGLPDTPLTLTGEGSDEALDLERLRAELLGGAATARGRVAWSPRVEWSLAVDGEDLDPAAMWAAGEGRLALTARTEGHLEEAGPVGRVDPLVVNGTLRGEPLAGTAAVALAGERIALDDLDLDWGSLRLDASGRAAPDLDLDFALEAPRLAVALPGAAGAVSAEGRLSGPHATPRIELTADGEGLAWNDLALAQLDLRADLDLAPDGSLALDLEARRLVAFERGFDQVVVAGQGSRGAHRLRVDVEAPDGSLALAAAGGLSPELAWSGVVERLDLALPEAGDWALAGPAAVEASAEAARLERLCEVSGQGSLCLAGDWTAADGWRGEADLTSLPLSLLEPFLPPDLGITGTVGGRVEAESDASGTLSAQAELQPGPGTASYPLADGTRETVPFGAGELVATVDGEGVRGRLELPLEELGRLAAELSLPGYGIGEAAADRQPITGSLRAEIRDLSFLQGFSDQLDQTAGRFDADLRVDGVLASPRIRGEARLEDGRASLPELGIELEDLRLAVVDRGGDGLAIEGSVRSGDGTLTLGGEAPDRPTAGRPLRLTVTGSRFEAMNTPDFELLVSPDLEVVYDDRSLAVRGEVVVPEATIELAKAPAGTVTVSDDVVYVGGRVEEAAAEAGAPRPLSLRVRVVLGDDVEIDVLGLQAEPTGSLLLIEESGGPMVGSGQVDLAGGTFQAYGQDLTIERGRLIFGGPLGNPRVDLRAYRKARDGVVAGLEARGSLEAPEISLWSEPPMDQSNQLSYILLGRPVGQASSAEGDLLANAAISLGLKGGNLLAEKLAARFGLEEARIETDGGLEEASLVLGKYLSPRLYVAYGVGLFEAVNTLRLRYLLSSKWTLEATTGAGEGVDLFYTLERGRGAKRRAPRGDDPLDPPTVPPPGADGSNDSP